MLHAKSFLFSMSFLMSACIVHHHHYGEGPIPESETRAVDPAVDPGTDTRWSAEPDEIRAQPTGHREPAAKAPPAPTVEQELVPVPSAPGSVAQAFLPGCATEIHPSGWILSACGDMRFILVTGPAAKRPDVTLSSLVVDEVTRQVAGSLNAGIGVSSVPEGEVTLAGNAFPVRRLTAGPHGQAELNPFVPPPARPYHGSGLFTVVRSDAGKAALACHQEGDLDEARCLSLLDGLLRRGLSDVAPAPDATVSVAGVPMVFGESCHYNGPTTLLCHLNGSLRWFKGNPAEARRRMQNLLHAHENHFDVPGYHNPHDAFACRIGGRSAECHEIAVQGVLDTPNKIVYAAVVDTSEGTYQLSCQVRVGNAMNEPCRLLFSGAHSGRWH